MVAQGGTQFLYVCHANHRYSFDIALPMWSATDRLVILAPRSYLADSWFRSTDLDDI